MSTPGGGPPLHSAWDGMGFRYSFFYREGRIAIARHGLDMRGVSSHGNLSSTQGLRVKHQFGMWKMGRTNSVIRLSRKKKKKRRTLLRHLRLARQNRYANCPSVDMLFTNIHMAPQWTFAPVQVFHVSIFFGDPWPTPIASLSRFELLKVNRDINRRS